MDFLNWPASWGNPVELQGGGMTSSEAWGFMLKAKPRLARVRPHSPSAAAGTGMGRQTVELLIQGWGLQGNSQEMLEGVGLLQKLGRKRF